MTKKLSVADCERIGYAAIYHLGPLYDGHSFFEEVKKRILAELRIDPTPYKRNLAPGPDALQRLVAQYTEEGSGATLDRLHRLKIQSLREEWGHTGYSR